MMLEAENGGFLLLMLHYAKNPFFSLPVFRRVKLAPLINTTNKKSSTSKQNAALFGNLLWL